MKHRRAVASVLMLVVLGSAAVATQSGYVDVSLYSLGFNYWPPKPADVKAGRSAKSTVPAKIQALNGKKVRLDGFMIPYDQASMRVSEFMLVADYDSCSFGDLPTSLADWVYVSLPDGRFAHYTTTPIVATGRFEVGEEFDKDGFVSSLYRLHADKVE